VDTIEVPKLQTMVPILVTVIPVQALFDRDKAQRKAQELAREIETLLAGIEEFEKLVQHLRDDNTTLKHQVVDMQQQNDTLGLKIETEMVLRTGDCPRSNFYFFRPF
jgi:hypothetical protein